MRMSTEITEARSRFPAGLKQPEGSFHFSADALLLADFASEAASDSDSSFADIGSGCGVIVLSMLLKRKEVHGVGLEILTPLAEAAEKNAALLGVEDRFRMVSGNAGEYACLRSMRRALAAMRCEEGLPLFDSVVCNPPWRLAGTGRLPPSDARRTALFGDRGTFGIFFRAADALLRHHGTLYAVAGAGRTADLLDSLPERMHPELLRFVFTKSDSPAEFVLMKAVKNGRGLLQVVCSTAPPAC